MTSSVEAVLREALALPLNNRADVVSELLASLDAPAGDDPATVGSLWNRELELRARGALAGDTVDEPWADVRQRLADELAG
jgi:hypothetical protein